MRTAAQRRLAAFGLALALLFAQHHALLHWLGHASDAVRSVHVDAGRTAPHDAPATQPACDECAVLVAFDAVLPSSVPLLQAPAVRHALPEAQARAGRHAAPALGYRSRAPPVVG